MIVSPNNDKYLKNSDSKNWYALRTKPRQEFKAELQLKNLDIEYYLPVFVKKKKWSDRVKEINEPVIRGYIFIKSNESERLKALEQISISKCLFDQGKPAVIPEWQIENLMRMLKVKSDFFVYEGLVAGTKVEIVQGPFTGVIGVIQSKADKKMFAVSIELLNRTVIAHLPKDSVEAINVL
ncbi:MAG: UpxY family transcription antiterminator [Ignavibacteria bacterium]|nr:UpxY family transcription antiterminator [Ignavibacteria bacterium]